MKFRTDLAVEVRESVGNNINGVTYHEEQVEDIKIERLRVETNEAEKKIGKPKGNYITITVPALTDNFQESENKINIISKEIDKLIDKKGLILVAGLGNYNITPDALGPKTANMVLATRHITGEIARSTGLDKLRPVAVLSPGVLGQTGIEAGEFILSVIEKLKPCALIVIDALASRDLARLGCTIQISDTGISPGSGVGNARPKINKETMGIPVISMGIPTVVDAATLAADLLLDSATKNADENRKLREKMSPRGEAMMVTPREIDLLIERAAKLTAMAINCALHKEFSQQDLLTLAL